MSCISLRSRTPQSGGSSDRGSKRRSVGERRLHLRKTPPSRDRSAHPLLINAAEGRRGSGPEAQKKLDQVFFGASVIYANERATRTVTIVCASVPTSRLTGIRRRFVVYRRSANRGACTRGARDPLKEKLYFATVDSVALHEKVDQGIVNQLGSEHPAMSITSLLG